MKKPVFSLLIAFLLGTGLYAQTVDPNQFFPARNFQLTPPTPMVSQFLRYDELPVSEYTGIPNISIPLHDIEVDGVTVPLTLSYHASGLQVNQDASWVGMGWDLTGASIIQYINDLDDLSTNPINGEKNSKGNVKMLPNWMGSSVSTYSGYAYYPIPSSWETQLKRYGYPGINDREPIISNPTEEFNYWLCAKNYFSFNKTRKEEDRFFRQYAMNESDSEPDIFKVSLFGTTLNMIMDFHTGNFVVLNKKGYQVNLDNETKTFTVKTPDGDHYIFADTLETNTYRVSSTLSYTASGKMLSKRMWLLNRIQTKYGKEIRFEYEKCATRLKTKTITESGHPSTTYNHAQYKSGTHVILSSTHSGASPGPIWIGDTIYNWETQHYLKNIYAPDVNISFTLKDRTDISPAKQLEYIYFNTRGYTLIRTIRFHYSYLGDKSGGTTRLFLNSLEDNEKKYSFTYNSTALPPKNSFEQDYWGYPNGQSGNKSYSPNPHRFGYKKDDGSSMDNGNNKSADLAYTRSRILESITYPTGGSVHFDYELNEFSNYRVPDIHTTANTLSHGYGLRVKSITYKDQNGEQVKKTVYKYEEGLAVIKQSFIEKFTRYYYKSANDDGITTHSSVINYISTKELDVSLGFYEQNPLSSHSGVGYGKVFRYQYDKDNKYEGYIETEFYNNPDIVPKQPGGGQNATSFVSLPAFKDSRYPENGTEKKRIVYDKNNDPVKESTFSYINKKSALYYGARVSSYGAWAYWNGTGNSFYAEFNLTPMDIVGLYPIFDFESLPSSTTETEYRDGNKVSVTTTYSYNSNNLVSTVNQTGYRRINYTYPQDYTTDVYKQMVSNNILTPTVETTFVGQQGNIIGRERVNYTNNSSITGGHFLPGSIERSYLNGSGNETIVTYTKYNAWGKPVEFTTSDGVTTVYLWGYYGDLPVAEIKNASYATVSRILGNDLINKLENSSLYAEDLIAIRNLQSNTELSQAYVTVFEHKPLVGISRATAVNGIDTYYEYDKRHHLKMIKDHQQIPMEIYAFHYQGTDTDGLRPLPLEITSVQVNNREITVEYTGCDENTNTSMISWYDTYNGQSVNSTAGCTGSRTITVPTKGHTYRITVRIYYYNGSIAEAEVMVNV